MSAADLFAQAAAVPEHMLRAADAGSALRALPHLSEIDNIVILGLGSARTVGGALRTLCAPALAVPLLVESGYQLPTFVGKRSLVFAISGSGDTNEVNHMTAAAAASGAHIVVVSAVGWLTALADERDLPAIAIPPEVRPARASFGFALAAVLATLQAAGFPLDTGAWIDGAAAQLRQRRQELLRDDSVAARLAEALAGRHVSLQGDNTLGAIAAERWKAQINQNARQPAGFSEQPNASHNEAVAWDLKSGDLVGTEAMVMLRHQYEDSRLSRAMEQLAAYLDGKVPVHIVRGEGANRLATLMDLAMIGDFTSLHLSVRNGVDPSSMRFISETLKEGAIPPDLSKSAARL